MGRVAGLVLISVKELKTYLPAYLLSSLIAPLTYLAVVYLYGEAYGLGPDAYAYMVRGLIASSIIAGGLAYAANTAASYRQSGVEEFYSSLGVAPELYLAVRQAAYLPLVMASILVGAAAWHVLVGGWPNTPLLLAVAAASGLAYTGIGSRIGLAAGNPANAGGLSMLATYLLIFAAPVYYPENAMPSPLPTIAELLPSTHTARLIAAALRGTHAPLTSIAYTLLLVAPPLARLIKELARKTPQNRRHSNKNNIYISNNR